MSAVLDAGPAAAAGIHRFALPTPFDVGTVNAFLVEDDPLVLVDCGPATPAALAALEDGLRELGHELDDLELLVLTHAHSDHFGLAAELVRRTGVAVAALDVVADVVERWDAWAAASDVDCAGGLVRHGMDPDVVASQRLPGFVQRAWGADVAVDRRLRQGDVLELRDRRLDVLHLPGHSPGDLALLDRDTRVLLAGDHLLADVPVNAIVRPRGPGGRLRDPALLAYRESLRRTRALDLDVVLGGHGPAFGGHRELIDARLAAHERRADRLAEMLQRGPRTAHELARELWGTAAVEQPLATTSMVLGHLDLLVAEGRAVEHDDGRRTRFVAARSSAPAHEADAGSSEGGACR